MASESTSPLPLFKIEGASQRAEFPLPFVVVFAFSFFALLFFSTSYGFPVPKYHDEFSYLLGADTFASGRLTNPTHPMHAWFESFHIFHTPTYQSKYPPAQAAFLALGQVVSGEPAVGVWISYALACAATCWMLLALFPTRWAMLGGFIPLFNPQLFLFWGHSFWGGAVAWFGSALLVGALLRMCVLNRTRDAVVCGLGLFILANSRPAESLLLCVLLIPGVMVLLRKYQSASFRRILLGWWPLLLWGGVIVGWTLFYNHALVRDMFTFPHTHFARVQEATDSISWRASRATMGRGLELFGQYFLALWPILALPVLFLNPACRKPAGYAAGIIVFMLLISTAFTSGYPHYQAPLYPLYLLLLLWGLFELAKTKPGWARALVVLQVCTWVSVVSVKIWQGPKEDWDIQRQQLLDTLESQAGDQKYLVVVDTAPNWNRHRELVYNRADIDAAKVVFARSAGPEKNTPLLDYFSDREVIPLYVGNQPAPPVKADEE